MMRAAPLILTLLLAASPALAAPQTYTYDPAHTQILFSVEHLGFSHPSGRFKKFDGGFTFDRKKPEKSEINAEIDAASIDMGSETWNTAMRGKDFLNAEKFPKITFTSTKIEKTGTGAGKMTGDLTLLGVTRPVTLDVTHNKSGVNPYNRNYIAGFSATGEINRADFGMTFGLPGISDTVKIHIEVEGIRRDFEKLAQ